MFGQVRANDICGPVEHYRLQGAHRHVLILRSELVLWRNQVSSLRSRPKPKKAYPNSDRFEEDGRRIYSAYAAADGKKPVNRRKQQRRRILIAGASIAAVVSALVYLIGAG